MPLPDALLGPEDFSAPEARYPLRVVLCGGCALSQITYAVPPEELFGADYPYYSSFSEQIVSHAKANAAARIAERGLGAESRVVEIASNDGYLLRNYVAEGIPALGIDPASGPAAAAADHGVETIRDFFGLDLARSLVAEGVRADVLHANNVLAHQSDLNGFVAGVAEILKPDGQAVIEVPYLKDLVEFVEFDTIYHEHISYFTVGSLCPLLERHGLTLHDVERLSIHGGSLRLFVGHGGEISPSVLEALEAEGGSGMDRIEFYEDFSQRVRRLVHDLGAMVRNLKDDGAGVAAYGAAAKGTVLLNVTGLGRREIDFVVDRNVHKQGRYMPGVHLPIREPSALLEELPDYVLLLPWNLEDEILAQQTEYRRRGGRFIIPVPVPKIV